MFEKIYELSLQREYVSNWGLAEAVRELIQNALDSDSPFVYEFESGDGYGESRLILRSEFTTLLPSTLLLGSTSKASNPDAIGSFGEGYKIALLVLTRLGKPVSISNGNVAWTPEFRYNSRFGTDLLAVKETSLSYKHTGLTFYIGGLTTDECSSIRESCLRMQDSIGAIKTTSKGDILLDKPGLLYVGSLFICETQHSFGYNILPSHIRLERDRQTVNSWDMESLTTDMWFETEDYDKVAQLISDGVRDVGHAEYGSPELVKEACYRLFREKHPGAIIAKNPQHLRELVESGLTNTVYVGGSMYSAVSSSQSYRKEALVKCETIPERMERWLSKNKQKMQASAIVAFKDLISESRLWKK